MMNSISNPIESNQNMYNNSNAAQIGYGVPLSGTTTVTDSNLLPLYDSINHQKQAIKSGASTLTYNNNTATATTNSNNNNNNFSDLITSRKRSRDSINPLISYQSLQTNKNSSPFSFLGHDVSFQIQQQQFDIDNLVSHHVSIINII